jgi:hypothetical protein
MASNFLLGMPHPKDMSFSFQDNADMPDPQELYEFVEQARSDYSCARAAEAAAAEQADIIDTDAFVASLLNNEEDDSLSSEPLSVSSSVSTSTSSIADIVPLPLYSEAHLRLSAISAKGSALASLVPADNLVMLVNVIDTRVTYSRAVYNYTIRVADLTEDLLEELLCFDREEKPGYAEDLTRLSKHFNAVLRGGCLEPHMIALDVTNLYYYGTEQ